jgi:hypothetical protein
MLSLQFVLVDSSCRMKCTRDYFHHAPYASHYLANTRVLVSMSLTPPLRALLPNTGCRILITELTLRNRRAGVTSTW